MAKDDSTHTSVILYLHILLFTFGGRPALLSRPEQKLSDTSIVHPDSDCKPSDPLLGVDYQGLLVFLQSFEELTQGSSTG